MLIYSAKSFCQANLGQNGKQPEEYSIEYFRETWEADNDYTWAFIKAGKFISNRWDRYGTPLQGTATNYNTSTKYIRLVIPGNKTYRVGYQYPRPSTHCTQNPIPQVNIPYATIFNMPAGLHATANFTSTPGNISKWAGLDLIHIDNNVDQVEITSFQNGAARPKIVYNDGLYYGYYNCSGTAQTNVTNTSFDTYVRHFIWTEGIKNISISNLDIDGNNTPPTTQYDGNFLGEGNQMGADGILLQNTKKITISFVDAHHMTHDGAQIQDFYTNPNDNTEPALTKLLMNDCNYDFNRRQGFSWTGGRYIRVNNCSFNTTGKSVFGWNGGIANGNPAAGIDIEPEGPEATPFYCIDGIFTDCSAKDNRGAALTSTNPISANRSKEVTFNNVLFHDVTGVAVVITQPKTFVFNDCELWGGFLHFDPVTWQPGEEPLFNRCDFADVDIQNITDVSQRNFKLVEFGTSSTAKRVAFNDCTFRAIHSQIRLLWLRTPSANEQDFHKFTNCTFRYESNATQNTGTLNVLAGCIFSGNNRMENDNLNSLLEISAKGIVFIGSTIPCSPHSFTLKGKVRLGYANSNTDPSNLYVMGRTGTTGTAGYFNFNIEDKANLYNTANTILTIGQNSVLQNKAGGQMVTLGGTAGSPSTYTQIHNYGKMIFENNSSSNFPNPASTSIIGYAASEVYYHKNALANVNSTWFSSHGYSPFAIYGVILNGVLFDGGHNSIPLSLRTSTNEALTFDGVNDYVQVPLPAAPSRFNWSTVNPFSLEIAFKQNGPLGALGGSHLFEQSNGLVVALEGMPGQLANAIWISCTNTSYAPMEEISFSMPNNDNSCHFLTITRGTNDSKIRVYLDNNTDPVFISTSNNPINGYLLPPYNTLKFGNIFNGWIGQVRLWNRALTAEDICYNNKRKKPLNTTGLWADWDMTDASGTKVTNSINPGPTTNGTFINGTGNNWVSQNEVGNCTATNGTSNSFNNFRPTPTKNNVTITQPSSQKQYIIYPNPSNGEFEIRLNKAANKQAVFIYNTAGKLIYTKDFANEQNQTVNLQNAANGMYIIKLINGVEISVGKITVSH